MLYIILSTLWIICGLFAMLLALNAKYIKFSLKSVLRYSIFGLLAVIYIVYYDAKQSQIELDIAEFKRTWDNNEEHQDKPLTLHHIKDMQEEFKLSAYDLETNAENQNHDHHMFI